MNAKIKNALKIRKRNNLKIRKQKLCNKINQCKSIKEIKEWERTFLFHSVLKNDYDYDYGYLLDLIEFKLRLMRDYFWTHNIVEGERQLGNICNTLINILKAGYKTEYVISKDIPNYVNIKNANKYLSNKELELLTEDKYLYDKYGLAIIRETKAKKIFWKYLQRHIEHLWE